MSTTATVYSYDYQIPNSTYGLAIAAFNTCNTEQPSAFAILINNGQKASNAYTLCGGTSEIPIPTVGNVEVSWGGGVDNLEYFTVSLNGKDITGSAGPTKNNIPCGTLPGAGVSPAVACPPPSVKPPPSTGGNNNKPPPTPDGGGGNDDDTQPPEDDTPQTKPKDITMWVIVGIGILLLLLAFFYFYNKRETF